MADKRKRKLDDELWREFIVPARGDAVPMFCGLCGNCGILRIGQERTPAGVELERSDAYCICQNGRALKARAARKVAK